MTRYPELHDALQSFSVACRRRLILLDPNSAVMAYSIHETREDRARLAYVMTHSDLWEISGRSRYQIEIHTFDEIGEVALVPVVGSDHHLLATLVYPMGGDGDPGDLGHLETSDELELVRALLEAEKSMAGTFNTITSELVSELISEEELSRHLAIQELMDRNLISAAEGYTVVVLGPGRDPASHRDSHRVRLAVAQVIRFVNVRSTASVVGGMLADGHGVLIFPRPVQKDQLTRQLEHPDLIPVRAGIGPIAPLGQLHRSYLRARWALRASMKLPNIYPTSLAWQDSGIDGYIASMPIDAIEPDDLPAPLATIMADRHVSRWIETLWVYLESGGNIPKTAQILQIHRSTVYYRLDRMGQVAGIDLADTQYHQALLFGLLLVRQFPALFGDRNPSPDP